MSGLKELTFREVKSLDTVVIEESMFESLAECTQVYRTVPFRSFFNELVIKYAVSDSVLTYIRYVMISDTTMSVQCYAYARDLYYFALLAEFEAEVKGDVLHTTNISTFTTSSAIKTPISHVVDMTEAFIVGVNAYIYKAKTNPKVVIKTYSPRPQSTSFSRGNAPAAPLKHTVVISDIKVLTYNKSTIHSLRSYTHHIDSFEVMGHMRVLKSGKTTFVRPYTKGKKDGEKVAREYKLKVDGNE